MTFRELFKQKNGYDVIVANRDKNVYPCPSKYGYEAKNPTICRRMLDCKSCWECEVPQKSCESVNRAEVENGVQRHKALCKEIHELYERKNHDYGDSFHKGYAEDGVLMAKIRIGDKYNRFKSLIQKDRKVLDESTRDTLLDLANYCILTVMELDNAESKMDLDGLIE